MSFRRNTDLLLFFLGSYLTVQPLAVSDSFCPVTTQPLQVLRLADLRRS